jgi:hypothetical protein
MKTTHLHLQDLMEHPLPFESNCDTGTLGRLDNNVCSLPLFLS